MSTFPANAAASFEAAELEWNDLAVILAICRAGSLSGAARLLGHTHSTIFRKINAIEQKTAVRFFERLQDGYAMTEAGETAQRYAERIEAEVHALSREVIGQDMRLQGKVRLTAPEGMTNHLAPDLLAGFIRQHPEVSIEIAGGTLAVDLARREADLAIRATRKPPDTSLGRKVCDFRFAAFATKEYARQHKAVPLSEQKCCLITGIVDWLVPLVWKKKTHGERLTVYASTSSQSVINATAAGLGFTFLPCYLGDADKRLVRITDLAETLTLELWLLTHPDLRHTARVKALMSYLYDALKKESDLFAGERPQGSAGVKFSL